MDINKMSEADLTNDSADLLEKAVLRMLFSKSDATFFAYFLVKMAINRTPAPPHSLGMGVAVHDGVFTLNFDEERLIECKINDIETVCWILGHESMHWVLNHHYRERDYWSQDEDKIMQHHKLFNIAMDLEIHELYEPCQTMADKVCVVGKPDTPFEKLPRKATAEEYFELLKQNCEMQEPQDGQGQPGEGGQPGQPGQPGQQGQSGQNSSKRFKVEVRGTKVKITDTQTGQQWEFDTSDQGAPQKDSQEDLNKEVLRQHLAESLKDARPSMGTDPGGLVSVIERFIAPPRIDWRHRFRHLVGKYVRFSWHGSWKRFSRRLGEGFRGRIRDHGLFICAIVDTSGSVGDDYLMEFNNEMDHMRRVHKVKRLMIVEADAAVQAIYDLKPYNRINCQFKGRGGTDFRPAFEMLDKMREKPDLVIYLTDSCGSFPEHKPVGYPVLWAVTTESDLGCAGGSTEGRIPWGDVVIMELDKERRAPK